METRIIGNKLKKLVLDDKSKYKINNNILYMSLNNYFAHPLSIMRVRGFTLIVPLTYPSRRKDVEIDP